MPAAQANLYCDRGDVEALLSALGLDVRLDDDAGGDVSAGEEGFLAKAINWATARVKLFCLVHYDDSELAGSWLVNDWATVLAARYVCARRLNPLPDTIERLYSGDGGGDRGVMGDLTDVRLRKLQIPDVGYRNTDWPAWSNVTVDPRYRVRQVRVQRGLSERKQVPQHPQAPDWRAETSFNEV